jgi:polyisoprenoid-binding protein YceI
MKLKTAGFTASTTIKRSEFGITTYVPNLGDDVKIDIESEANILPKQ